MKSKDIARACAPLVCLVLAGCFSNEPGADDILNAVSNAPALRQYYMLTYPGVNFNSPSAVEAAVSRALTGAKVEKLGCSEKPGLPGIICEFNLGLTMPNGQLRYQKSMQRFLKVNGSWQFAG